MYLPVTSQPDCLSAWREAVRAVDAQPGHHAHNVILDIENPLARASLADPAVRLVDTFLRGRGKKPIETVANTIFPASLYHRHGAPKFFDRFRDNVLPSVRRSADWSGYYFERMMQLPQPHGDPINQLWEIVGRIRDPDVRALNKFELSVFDPARDVDRSPYGGQCMSFASMKLIDQGGARRLGVTVLYRNHFYIEKLLGNIIGLGRLMSFVAKEGGVETGSLTIVSTHAQIDQPGGATRGDLTALLDACDQANAALPAAA